MMATPRLHVSLNIFVMAKYPKYPCKGQAQTRTTFELEGLIGHILFRAVAVSENIQVLQVAIFPQKIATISLIPVSNIASLLP